MNLFARLILLVGLVWLSQKQAIATEVEIWFSSEFHANDKRWFAPAWEEQDIPYKLSKQPGLEWQDQAGSSGVKIVLDPSRQYQQIEGIGASLEHATIYAIRKNKTLEQQQTLLKSLIDPVNGIGMNMFRISIGTSDFANGLLSLPKPSTDKGWYSFQDDPEKAFSIERNRNLGILDTIKMAYRIGQQSNNPLRFVATPWSPPAWMREGNSMVQGGPLKTDMLDRYAQYLREFVQAYRAEGIPIYALTLQNERQFEPDAYPGMHISWELERDLLIKVYENFHNIGGEFGDELNVKLWGLDHNFNYWQQAEAQISSLKSLGKDHYLDGTAFHHYEGDSAQMAQLHNAHPDKAVIFTEGSVWGIGAEDPNRGFQSVIRHFRHWSTAYLSWVTMLTQNPAEANQGPYNYVGKVGPTMLIQRDGESPEWFKTPEYWLMGQFSRFIQPGAVRIGSSEGNISHLSNVAFINPDDTIVLLVANSSGETQTATIAFQGRRINSEIPSGVIASYRWPNKKQVDVRD